MGTLRGFIALAVTALLLVAPGCSDDDPSGPGSGSTTAQGVFLDSAVEGLDFVAGEMAGTTDTQGTFTYPRSASSIDFQLGDIVLGSGPPAAVMTPFSLSPPAQGLSDPKAINIARLLQTLDDDGDPDNGVLLSPAVRSAAAGRSVDFDQDTVAFGNDANVQSVVADLTAETGAGPRPLVPTASAEEHLRETLRAALQGQYNGIYCRDTDPEGQTQNRAGTWTMNVTPTSLNISFNGNPSFSLTGDIDGYGNIEATAQGGQFIYGGYDGQEFSGRWYTDTESGTFTQGSSCN